MPANILFVDDDRSMLNLYTRIFSGTDYSVSMAASVGEAAALIRENDYDLLVTDFMFPDGLGTELIKQFEGKKGAGRSVLVTGSVAAPPRERVPGLAGYFSKPFRVKEFVEAVSKALS